MGQLVSRVTVARYGQISPQNLAWKDLLEVRNAVDLKLRSPTCACQHPRVRRQGVEPADGCRNVIW